MAESCRAVNSAALRAGAVVQKVSHSVKSKIFNWKEKARFEVQNTIAHEVCKGIKQIRLGSIEFISDFVRVYSPISLKGICKCIQQSRKLLAFSLIFRICPATFGKQ